MSLLESSIFSCEAELAEKRGLALLAFELADLDSIYGTPQKMLLWPMLSDGSAG